MPSQHPRRIDCDEHGPSLPWMVCVHLREGRRLSYDRVQFEPVGQDLTAVFCQRCARLLFEEDSWNEKLADFADWKLYCEPCWLREKRRRGHRLKSKGRITPQYE
jgi:hypothetical protein